MSRETLSLLPLFFPLFFTSLPAFLKCSVLEMIDGTGADGKGAMICRGDKMRTAHCFGTHSKNLVQALASPKRYEILGDMVIGYPGLRRLDYLLYLLMRYKQCSFFDLPDYIREWFLQTPQFDWVKVRRKKGWMEVCKKDSCLRCHYKFLDETCDRLIFPGFHP